MSIGWIDNATGLCCQMVYNDSIGIWCGYVAVPKGHVCHGLHYDRIRRADGDWIDVHGGLTFAGKTDEYRDAAPEGYWWFGFDCGHAGDLCKGLMMRPNSDDVFRDEAYVKDEIRRLATQLLTAIPGKGPFDDEE